MLEDLRRLLGDAEDGGSTVKGRASTE